MVALKRTDESSVVFIRREEAIVILSAMCSLMKYERLTPDNADTYKSAVKKVADAFGIQVAFTEIKS